MNQLYYGDNLTVLRGCIADESVDLIYLDPPFNSQATYNVLFRGTSGEKSRAQIEAFDDTWHWGDEAELAFDGVMTGQNSDAPEMLRSMRAFLKENDMMAYPSMMAVRLLELHRLAAMVLRLCGCEAYGLDVVERATARPQWLSAIGGNYLDGRKLQADKVGESCGPMDLIVDASGIAPLEFNLLEALDIDGATC